MLLLHNPRIPSFYRSSMLLQALVSTHDFKSAKSARGCSSSLPTPRLREVGSQASSSSSRLSCTNDQNARESSFQWQGFSVLGSDAPWDSSTVWSTFAFYLFSLHIPLSFWGLPVVARVLQRPVLNPQAKFSSVIACHSGVGVGCHTISA